MCRLYCFRIAEFAAYGARTFPLECEETHGWTAMNPRQNEKNIRTSWHSSCTVIVRKTQRQNLGDIGRICKRSRSTVFLRRMENEDERDSKESMAKIL